MKRITASLCLIALLLGLASCGKEASKEPETNGTPETSTTPVEESTETEDTRLTSGLPDDFDLGGKSIRVLQFHSDADILPIDVAEMTGDTLNDAIYTANQSVMDKLNCVYDFIDNEDIETTKLENTYAAGEDAYDLVIGVQWKVAPLVTKHMFANLNPSTGNYIDLDQPWWYGKYIAETEADGTHTYFLAGDASVNVFRRASMLICNMDLLENIGEDIDALYDKVLDGTWVWDDFVGLVEKVYVDNNGDGKKDGGDTYGFATWSRADVDHLMIDSGIRACGRDEDGVPYIAFNNEKTIDTVQKIADLFWNNPGSYYEEKLSLPTLLSENRVLFIKNLFAGLDEIRDIDTSFTVLPIPKLDETISDYSSLVHDDAAIFCVPIQSGSVNDTTAVLEEMSCQYYNDVMPTYYNVILKTKYRRDGSDKASQIMDILHDSMTTDFAYIYNYAMGNMIISLRDLIGIDKSTDFASHYAKNEKKYEDSLAKMIDAIRE